MIRHGEKPPKQADGKDADGLSAEGVSRAQGLRQVFGKDSQYNIGYILAEHPKSGLCLSLANFNHLLTSNVDGGRDRPYETVLPLSQDLGLVINSMIGRDDGSYYLCHFFSFLSHIFNPEELPASPKCRFAE